jgi:uncharacterized protein
MKPNSFHLIIKPIGSVCNLNCTYCYYRSKKELFPDTKNFVMDERLLEELIEQTILGQESQTINFTWQGGEPTLLGIDFFQKIIKIQQKYAGTKKISNDLQTNGTFLDDDWCQFLHDHSFLVGLSIDGPPELHDLYRRDHRGDATCDRVVQAAELMQKYQVEFNTLTVLNQKNAKHPEAVYRFLKDRVGSKYMQFIPCVERNANEVTEWSVDPIDYGNFLCQLFDRWLSQDLHRVFIMNFEATLNLLVGRASPLCFFSNCCGKSLAVEHDGSLFSCDHFVLPSYKLGNIKEKPLSILASLPSQECFGLNKLNSLSTECRRCKYLTLCYGECPKNRFLDPITRQIRPNYLCAGLKKYFSHVLPHMINWISQ